MIFKKVCYTNYYLDIWIFLPSSEDFYHRQRERMCTMKYKWPRVTALLLTIVMAFSFLTVPAGAEGENENSEYTYAGIKLTETIDSKAAYMVNLDTGTVMYRKNENKQMYPASFTKIMTAILVLESGADLDSTVITAPPYIFDELYGLGASTADIRPNEEVTLRDLLYALLLPSACEAGSILADYFGDGSIQNFVDKMNAKAAELGCKNTHFVNAHGLHSPDQYTTAYDMYLITKHAMTLSPFLEIACTPQYTMAATNKHDSTRNIYHSNAMMSGGRGGDYYYPDIKGGKTGTTDEAGKNLVSMATKDGYNYLLITMGAAAEPQNMSYVDAINLYDWAFDNFQIKTVMETTETVAEITVNQSWDRDHMLLTPEQDVKALIPTVVDPSSIQRDVSEVPESVTAPIEKGQVICQVKLKLADDVFETVNLVASEEAKRSTILMAWDGVKGFFSSFWFKLLIGVIIVLFAAYLTFMIMYNKKRKKNKVIHRKRKF